MSNQQSMFSPERSSQQQQQERFYNDAPREQYAQLYTQREQYAPACRTILYLLA